MNSPIHEQTVPPHLAGQRLDLALARMFPEFSRTRLKDWISQGLVTVDGRDMRPRDVVAGGETVVLRTQSAISVTSGPERIDLDIVYEDDDLLVLDKPPGLVVHPGAGNQRGTLMNGLLHRVPALRALPRAGIVHRLDKDTSGLLVVGKTLEAHTALVRQMSQREISRIYVAVCNGVLTAGGTVDAPIARHPVDRLRMSVRSGGKPAITHYRVLERFFAHTYIKVQLESGRTHQIRVHLAHIKHPLLGDPGYGGRLAIPAGANAALQDMLRGFRRQALHALRLEFVQPVSGKPLAFEAPIPGDFAKLLEALRVHVAGTGP
jgi:23S rRNA pseudouridine1911/1915/1917 synthase